MSSTVAPQPHRAYRVRYDCPGAVVIGANYRALGVVRSLGRHGIPVWVLRQEDELLPTGDENTALVARHHEGLGKQFQLSTLPWNVLCWVHDKRLLYRLAQCLA